MYLFGWINQLRAYGPWELLSGPLYRRKLLSLMFLCTPTCNSFNAKWFIHVSVRLDKSVWGQMALWGYCLGPLYRRKLLSLVFMWTLRCNSFNAKRFIHVTFRLNNAIWVWPLWGYYLGPSTGKNCCHCYFQYKYSPMSNMWQFLSVYCFSWINNFFGPYFVTPRLSVQDVTRQQCKSITLGPN